jgi:acetyl-CoA carboxylase biotin carboxyl carrier protein
MATKMQVDTALVRELAALLKETDLSEIEVADGERRVRVVRQQAAAAPVAPAPAAVSAPVTAAPVVTTTADRSAHPGCLRSPMVGTVYVAADPAKPPLVSVGSLVKEGDTLLIVEAMKVMNPITATRGGTVTQIFIENGQPIEFGEPLMIIE